MAGEGDGGEPSSLSCYDLAVPHPGPDRTLTDRFAALRPRRPAVPLDAIRDVVLLVGSSRGGTSVLTEILRGHPQLLSLPGEMNPCVVVAQLAGDDAAVFRDELARQIGQPADGAVDRSQLVADVQWRLTAQWPQLDLDAAPVSQWVDRAWSAGGADGFSRRLVEAIRSAGFGVAASAYDGGPGVACAAPAEPVVEMAPYVAFRPWRPATSADVQELPVVIAAPRNSYRLTWLAGQFPAARVRVLHVTRNPAASVNGLVDGWHHPAFFSTTVPHPLSIEGYSDRHPWGDRWWSFDVPPRWPELVASPLAAVAAEQWRSAHQAVFDATATVDFETLRVRYEDLVGSAPARAAVARLLADFLQVDVRSLRGPLLAGIDPVMATSPPQQRRWARADHDLAPALSEPAVWETAVELGYEADEALWI